MPFAKLSPAIAAALKAINEHDVAAVLATFTSDALITDRGNELRGRAIERWLEDRLSGSRVSVHPINLSKEAGRTILTVVLNGNSEEFGVATPAQLDWDFIVTAGKISAFKFGEETGPVLPAAVDSYVRATNTFDLDALVSAFADDALVNDQLRDYWGKAAITEWASADIIGYKTTMYVFKVVEHYRNIIVTAKVDGTYDKRNLPDPLELSFYFSEENGKIVQLIILRNQAGD
jgi:ketosteroid isomerase-like protein